MNAYKILNDKAFSDLESSLGEDAAYVSLKTTEIQGYNVLKVGEFIFIPQMFVGYIINDLLRKESK